MTPGLIAFFVVLSVMTAAYALWGPRRTIVRTGTEAPAEADDAPKSDQPDSIFDKWIRPAVTNILPQTPLALTQYARKNEKIAVLLARTGNPWRVSPEEYVVVRLLSVLAGVLVLMLMSVTGYFTLDLYIAVLLGALLGYIAPKSMLDSVWAKRRRNLTSTLPEALDLLRICMNAGYNFPNALQQTVELLPQETTREELSRVVAELRAGRTVTQALTGFAHRCPTEGAEAFVRSITQAQATGADIADTLAYQSSESRAEYERIVDTKAQKIQTTLFLPLIGFFLPVLVALIFGPAVTMLMGAL